MSLFPLLVLHMKPAAFLKFALYCSVIFVLQICYIDYIFFNRMNFYCIKLLLLFQWYSLKWKIFTWSFISKLVGPRKIILFYWNFVILVLKPDFFGQKPFVKLCFNNCTWHCLIYSEYCKFKTFVSCRSLQTQCL